MQYKPVSEITRPFLFSIPLSRQTELLEQAISQYREKYGLPRLLNYNSCTEKDEAWLNVTPFADYKWKIPFFHKEPKPLPHDFFDMIYRVLNKNWKRENIAQCFDSLKYGGILRIKAHGGNEERLITLLQDIGFENISKETETSSAWANFQAFNLKNLPKYEFADSFILEAQKPFENTLFADIDNIKLPTRYVGNYETFQLAQEIVGSGYDGQDIFDQHFSAAKAVYDGKAPWERDSCLFYHEEYREPLLGQLLEIAKNEKQLHVLDFGGAFGSTFYQHKRPILQYTKDFTWTVVEQAHFIDACQKEFPSGTLKFYHTCEEALQSQKINTLILSGVLQYLPGAYEWLNVFLKYNIKHIIFDRTAILKNQDRFVVDVVPEEFYSGGYAHHFLNQCTLEKLLNENSYLFKKWLPSRCDMPHFWGYLYAHRNLDKS